jgi:hypothetical protein
MKRWVFIAIAVATYVPEVALGSKPDTRLDQADQILEATCRDTSGEVHTIQNVTLVAGDSLVPALTYKIGGVEEKIGLPALTRLELSPPDKNGLAPALLWKKGAESPIQVALVLTVSVGKQAMPLHLASNGRSAGHIAIQDCRSIRFEALRL